MFNFLFNILSTSVMLHWPNIYSIFVLFSQLKIKNCIKY